MNKLFNQMKNQNNIMSIFNSSNPQAMAMNILQQRNPQTYEMISNMMNTGMSPQDAMKQLGINPNQIVDMKNRFR